MKHIRNKNELLAWLEKNAPRGAIANAMIDGEIELFGRFKPAPRSFYPGWVIKIISKRGMSWNVVVTMNKLTHKYCTYTIEMVQWENYLGGKTPLFAGDNPTEYRKLRHEKLN